MLADADVAIITQAAGSGRGFFQSKLLPTLATSRPVLSVADAKSELALAVDESGCVVNVLPDRVEELASALTRMVADPAMLESCARAGRACVEQFEERAVLERFVGSMGA